ncbi:MAG: hypothetical protein QOJ29_2526 [Thermoleophilaceae bacterium]|nr:hypothetical protein [Thermoleophilaceae bacterium]
MSVQQHEAAVKAYDDAIGALYRQPVEAMVASEADVDMPVADEAAVEAALSASQDAADATETLLADDDPLIREAGEARMAALAARDFALAFDVARLDEEEGATIASDERTAAALPEITRETAFLFESDPRSGVPASASGWEGMGTVADEEDPRAALANAAPAAIDAVRDAVQEIIVAGGKGLGSAGAGDALEKLLGGVLGKLPERVRRWWKWAVEAIKKGIDKLKKLFGDLFDKAVTKVKDWLNEHGIDRVLDFVYQSEDLKGEMKTLIERAPDDKDFAAVAKAIEEVVGKHDSQKKVVLVVFKALGWAHWALKKIVPAHALAITGALYGLGIAYGIVSGGDYVDWRRTEDDGFFDRVKGVRHTAVDALS